MIIELVQYVTYTASEMVQDSQKWCKEGPKLLLRTNRKSHTRFRLAPTAMTLDALERWKLTKIPAPTRKISTKIDLYFRLQNVGLAIYFPEI